MTIFAPNTPEYLNVDRSAVKTLRDEILGDQQAWIKKREGKENRYQLAEADFSGQELIGMNFRFADLRCAKFTDHANLSGADFYGADLRGTDFRNSYGFQTIFTEANLLESRFDNSGYEQAKFNETHLADANFERAKLKKADFSGAFLHNAKFEGADLHGAINFIPSSTLIRDARFSISSTDLWSQLRRSYTGPKFVTNLLFLTIFLTPYIAKAIYWSGINRSQLLFESLTTNVESHTIQTVFLCLASECEERNMWYLILGFDQAPTYWLLGIILISYNFLRGMLTIIVAPLRDEEERTGYSPRFNFRYSPPFNEYDETRGDGKLESISDFLRRARESYGWLKWPHFLNRTLLYFAVISFVWHFSNWLSLTVYIPSNG